MKASVCHFVLMTSLCIGGAASADDRPEAAAHAKTIAPLIDELSVAVIRVDLTQIRAKPLLAKAAEWLPVLKSQIEPMLPAVSAPLEKLKSAGATEVYAVLTAAGPISDDNFVFFAVPLSEQSDEQAIKVVMRQLIQAETHEMERLHGALVVASSYTLQRLRDAKPDGRPELAAAFEAVKDSAAQAILLPPKHTRRVIEEIMPELPGALGGGPSSILTNGVLWAAAGVKLDPNASISVVIQSRDNQAAQSLLPVWDNARQLLVEEEGDSDEFPDFERLLKLLSPVVKESRLVLRLDEGGEAFAIVIKAIGNDLKR